MEEKTCPANPDPGLKKDRQEGEGSPCSDAGRAETEPELGKEENELEPEGKQAGEEAGAEPGSLEGEPGDETAALETALEAAVRERDEYFRLLQRTQADFENYRRRVKKEREELIALANERLLRQFLPVLDNLERALQAEKEGVAPSFLEGIEMIYRQFQEVLAKEGVKPIPAVGEAFDPEKHEAVMQVEDPEKEAGIIVEELRKGYFLHDQVLRPSMVKVAK